MITELKQFGINKKLKGCLRNLLRIASQTNKISISTPGKNCNANDNLHLFFFHEFEILLKAANLRASMGMHNDQEYGKTL